MYGRLHSTYRSLGPILHLHLPSDRRLRKPSRQASPWKAVSPHLRTCPVRMSATPEKSQDGQHDSFARVEHVPTRDVGHLNDHIGHVDGNVLLTDRDGAVRKVPTPTYVGDRSSVLQQGQPGLLDTFADLNDFCCTGRNLPAKYQLLAARSLEFQQDLQMDHRLDHWTPLHIQCRFYLRFSRPLARLLQAVRATAL